MTDVLSLFLKLILLMIFAKLVQTATFKGWVGEFFVKLQLKRLDKDTYKIINDVTVKLDDGKTAQIDHVIVSEYGVFVIETKNYKGWIVGKEDDYYWKQVIYKRKEKLYNPLKQNQVHIDRLKEVLSHITDIPFISIVVFTTNADLKVETNKNLIYSLKLVQTIKKYNKKMLDAENAKLIYEDILEKNILDKETKKEHVKKIKEYKAENKSSLSICPRCNSELKNRKGKNGDFIGCSSYPKCRYTKSL